MQQEQLSQRSVHRQQRLLAPEKKFKRILLMSEWLPVWTGGLQIFATSVDRQLTKSKTTTRISMIDFRAHLHTEFGNSKTTKVNSHHTILISTETIDMTEAVLLLYLTLTRQLTQLWWFLLQNSIRRTLQTKLKFPDGTIVSSTQHLLFTWINHNYLCKQLGYPIIQESIRMVLTPTILISI